MFSAVELKKTAERWAKYNQCIQSWITKCPIIPTVDINIHGGSRELCFNNFFFGKIQLKKTETHKETVILLHVIKGMPFGLVLNLFKYG